MCSTGKRFGDLIARRRRLRENYWSREIGVGRVFCSLRRSRSRLRQRGGLRTCGIWNFLPRTSVMKAATRHQAGACGCYLVLHWREKRCRGRGCGKERGRVGRWQTTNPVKALKVTWRHELEKGGCERLPRRTATDYLAGSPAL